MMIKLIKNSLTTIGKYFFYGNFFMALCGVVWIMAAPYQLSLNINSIPWLLCLLVFSGVILIYNLARSPVISSQSFEYSSNEREIWIYQNMKVIKLLAGVAFLTVIILLFWLPVDKLWPLLPAGILVFLYYAPFWRSKSYGLRTLGFFKNAVIGIVWAIVTVLLPLTYKGMDWQTIEAGLLIFERVLFIFTIMLPFDLQDMDADEREGIRTIPSRLGTFKTKVLISLFCIIMGGVMIYHYEGRMLLANLTSIIYILILLIFLQKEREDLHSLVFWDGAIVVQGGLVLLV